MLEWRNGWTLKIRPNVRSGRGSHLDFLGHTVTMRKFSPLNTHTHGLSWESSG